jgi:hypothetical protein
MITTYSPALDNIENSASIRGIAEKIVVMAGPINARRMYPKDFL